MRYFKKVVKEAEIKKRTVELCETYYHSIIHSLKNVFLSH